MTHLQVRARLRTSGVPLLGSFVYLGLLTWSYLAVVGNSYYALDRGALQWYLIPLSLGMLTVVVVTAPVNRHRMSTLVAWLLILIAFVPQLTIFLVRAQSVPFMLATAAFWTVVNLVIQWPLQFAVPDVRVLAGGVGLRLAMLIYGLVVAASVAALALHGVDNLWRDFVRTSGDLHGAYDNRASFVADALPLNGYYLHWAALAFNPMFFILAMRRRLWLGAMAIVVFEVAIASYTGLRSYFLAIPFAVAVALVAGRSRAPLIIMGAIMAVMVAGVLVFLSGHGTYAYIFFTGRFLLDAGRLTFAYHDVFQGAPIPFAYLIKYFLHLPYPWAYPFLESPDIEVGIIGLHSRQAAVGGVVADGFMNMGYVGIAVWAAALGMLCKVIDAVSARVAPSVAGAALAMAVIGVAGTYLVRVLVTGGLIWTLGMLFLLSCSSLPRRGRRQGAHGASVMPAESTAPEPV